MRRRVTPPRSLAGGWVDPSSLPRGPNGRALCRRCLQEVPVGRRTFCSGAQMVTRWAGYGKPRVLVAPGSGCVHEHMVRSNPGYARKCVLARDGGRCAECLMVDPYWEMDHVTPVAEGGGSCGLENLRTLCRVHHRLATAALARRRAEARKENPCLSG